VSGHSRGGPVVHGDMTLLVQIFTNLVDNSLSYRKHGVMPEVEIFCHVDKGKVTVSIKDNGVGIAPEFHEKVFHIFQRLHSDAVKPGTGIGLAIVKKAVSMLGGQVELVSKEGAGSTFQIVLHLSEQE
jgi:signal transduction histidine kinase